jgi:predicted transcriptional regulator
MSKKLTSKVLAKFEAKRNVWQEVLDGVREIKAGGRKRKRIKAKPYVVLDVCTPSEAMADFVRVWKSGKGEKTARITFASPKLLWKVLTAKRWQLLKAMCGTGPLAIREAARRVGRDVKAVHTDATALLNAEVLDRVEDGRVILPFDSVKVEFLLSAA